MLTSAKEHVLTALANGLSLGVPHHAYLFSGTRVLVNLLSPGLLAKGLNCRHTDVPCGVLR
ncbi:hypothetical protein KCP78_00980 [Salmonella enterica subsp. enterica]|nr:hypothetical protein KCP78_00980 [Salmonella enterica subsp. enterica]